MNKAKHRKSVYPVGKRLNFFRVQKGFTLNHLARISGLSQSYLRAVELQTQNPSIGTLTQLCHALDISLLQFFEDEGSRSFLDDPIAKRIYHLNASQKQALSLFLDAISE